MDIVSSPLYRYIVRCASYLLLSYDETEDIAASLVGKHAAGKSNQEFQSFLQLPLTAHLRQDVKCDILDYKRKVARSRNREIHFSVEGNDSPPLKCCESQVRLEQIEHRLLVLSLLKRLPAEQRICIALRYFRHLDVKEIAFHLDIEPHTVEKRIQRGLKRLQQEWGSDAASTEML